MKTMFRCLIAATALLSLVQPATAQTGTSITYQGTVKLNGSPATGLYDFSFAVFNAAAGGLQAGGTFTTNAVAVTNGYFAATLDFGSIYSGNPLWLEISVRTNGAGGYATLAPRQPLTPTPYSLYAPSAGTATSASTATTASGVANNAVTAAGIAAGSVVKSLNALKDDVSLLAGANVTVTPGGQTLTLASPADWHLGGNTGIVAGAQFLGTLDGQPFELRVNNQRALLMDTNGNLAAGFGSTIQTALGTWGTTIGGGYLNGIQPGAALGTIAGGQQNVIQSGAWTCTIGGGGVHTVQTNASFATIPGGYFNAVGGSYSFAAGNHAKATNSGTFVWSDAQTADFGSTGSNQFLIRAQGGVGINTNNPNGAALNVNGTALASAVGIGTAPGDSTLNVLGQVRLNDANLVLRPGTDLNHGVGYRSFVDGPFVYGYNGGALGVAGPDMIALSWNYVGNVSVSNNLTVGSQFGANSIVVDDNGTNAGSLSPGLTFGVSSGEGISSKRTAGGNLYGLDFYTAFAPRMSVDNSGRVGIGTTTPDATLTVNGSADKPGGGSWSTFSDVRLKKNIQPLTGVLDKLLELHGVSFEYKEPEKIHELPGERIGMVAQEVERVFPDWVETGAAGYKRLTYRGFEALTVEALRELRDEKDAQLRAKDAEIQDLKARLEKLEQLIRTADEGPEWARPIATSPARPIDFPSGCGSLR